MVEGRRKPKLERGSSPESFFKEVTVKIDQPVEKSRRSRKFVLPKLPFLRLVREIALNCKADMRFQLTAIECLQEVTEAFVIWQMCK